MINIADVQAIKEIAQEVKEPSFLKVVESFEESIKSTLEKARMAQATANAKRVSAEAMKKEVK